MGDRAMLRLFGKKSGTNPASQRSFSEAQAAVEALYAMETQANLAALRERQRNNKNEKMVAHYLEYWPMAIGIAISLVAAQIHDMLLPLGPWAMGLVFPFVVIAGRPEIYMGDKVAALLPVAMLYLQFPLEGFMARTVLKGKVTVHGVIVQVLFYHMLGIVELILLNGFMASSVTK